MSYRCSDKNENNFYIEKMGYLVLKLTTVETFNRIYFMVKMKLVNLPKSANIWTFLGNLAG